MSSCLKILDLFRKSMVLLSFHLKIIKKLKELNLKRITIFNFLKSHDGYLYYYGFLKEMKVFVKVDTRLYHLKNEVVFYNIFKDKLSLIQVLDFYENQDFQILISEFTEDKQLNESEIIANPKILLDIFEILKIINHNLVIHRDVRLENFIIHDGHVRIIDFTFATSLQSLHLFKNLSVENNYELEVLKKIGCNFKPNILEWNDFYSMHQIIEQILDLQMLERERSLIKEYNTLFINKIKNNSLYL